MKSHVLQTAAILVSFAIAQRGWSGSVALPDLSVVGKPWGQVEFASRDGAPTVFPRQVVIDYNTDGVAYGITCEYVYSEKVTEELRSGIQRIIGVDPNPAIVGMVAWRNEDLKVTVTLRVDKETANIELIAVSIDDRVRGN